MFPSTLRTKTPSSSPLASKIRGVAGPRARAGISFLLALGGMLGLCAHVGAGTFTSGAATVSASANVPALCKVTVAATAIAFGTYDPIGSNSATGSDLQLAGTIQLQCLKNTSPTVELGNGLNFSATRRLRDTVSGDYLAYEIYQPTAATQTAVCSYSGTIWGKTGTYGQTFTPSATWSAPSTFTFYLCGVVPKGQNPTFGSGYQDTVVATVNF
jgi:spore coat protein U-like protein